MEYYQLTTPQKNIWNLQKYYADTAVGNICGAVFYHEKRDSVLLQQSVRQFIKNQSGLRLRFVEEKEPRQYVAEEAQDDIPVMEFPSMEEFDGYVQKTAGTPVGLTGHALYRFVVFQIGNQSGILAVLSHLISDAWTFGIMVSQFDKAYYKMLDRSDAALIEGNYIDYIHSEKEYRESPRFEKDRDFWEGKYSVCPEESPIKLVSALSEKIEARRITETLPLPLEQKITAYCQENPVTQAVLFEMAVIIYLSKINRENKTITIGVPMLNRSNAREKNIAGMFISTMPLTVSVAESMTVRELASQIGKGHIDIFRHQKYPYEEVLKYLREKQNFSGNLYDVMVSYQNARTDTASDTVWYSNGYSEVPFVLHIDNRDGKESHTINIDYQTAVFPQEKEVRYVIERLKYILEQMIENGDVLLSDISIVPDAEYEKIVYEFNDTAVDYAKDKCVHELFTEQAHKTPDKTALVFEDKEFTYRQLDEMSNSLAHLLREKGVGRNDVVPIIAKRSWHVVVAMLGVLKAGGAYMPVSPDYPQERIRFMLLESKAKIVLVYCYNLVIEGIESINLINTDYSCRITSIKNHNSLEDSCYIIYTSGSTGNPKGICQTHKCLSNLILWQMYQEKEYDNIVLADTVLTFDVATQEIFYSLINGNTMVLVEEDVKINTLLYFNTIESHRIDEIFTTPSYFSLICNPYNMKKIALLKRIIFAGEKFYIEKELLKKLIMYNIDIWNQYGPAETHVATCKQISDSSDITIGTPIANTQIYILDTHQHLLPIGVAGELCIAGDGVGKGYLNRPELTAERFLPNPFATAENGHGKVMYRTGDLARFREDGEIEYLGRMDTQVKIRGLRIELGEIESVMGSFDGILLCAAADKRDENGRQYLVGYYTSEKTIDERQLRKHLSAKLPKYMVPNYFVRLEEMPMTASGKTDRKNLPLPDFTISQEQYREPETETEKKLALIWSELLQTERIGRTDDFFELGGDSLLAITMITRVEEFFQIQISVKEIMEHSMLEQLAEVISDRKGNSIRIMSCHKDKYALLPQQKAVYAVCMKEPETLEYNMPAWVELPESVDRRRLEQCIRTVINHHRSFKTYILAENEQIYGVYDDNARIYFEKYRNDPIENFLRPFDLSKAPLIHIGFTEDKLLFDMHHIVADGESLNIMLRDILRAYAQEPLSDSEIQYSDYVQYFMEADFEPHKAFFRKMLKSELEPVNLPEQKATGKQGGDSKIFFLSGTVLNRAKNFADENRLTDTMLYFGAFGIKMYP